MIGDRDLKRLERIIELKNELYDCIERNKITRESILDSQDIRWMVSMPLLDITEQRAEELLGLSNMKTMDSLHVASAEVGGADVFLTTDDKLIKNAKNAELKIRVMNPVTYLAEVIENDK